MSGACSELYVVQLNEIISCCTAPSMQEVMGKLVDFCYRNSFLSPNDKVFLVINKCWRYDLSEAKMQ